MKTSLWLIVQVASLAALLTSCRDAELESLRAENRTQQLAAELKKQHRADLQALATRVASLESDKELLGARLEAELAERRLELRKLRPNRRTSPRQPQGQRRRKETTLLPERSG